MEVLYYLILELVLHQEMTSLRELKGRISLVLVCILIRTEVEQLTNLEVIREVEELPMTLLVLDNIIFHAL
jgi:hypothetical protein